MLKYNKDLLKKILLKLDYRIKLYQLYYEVKSGIITPSPKNKKNTIIYPNTIYIDIGSNCDGMCTDGCYIPKCDRQKDISLSGSNISDIINTAKYIKVNYLTILGGEPFDEINVDKTLLMIKNNPWIRFSACTNALNLNNNNAMNKVKSLVNLNIVFSIDGFEKTNDTIRGKGSYKASINALTNYSENGKRLSGVIITLRKKNIKETTSFEFINTMIQNGAYFIVYCVKFIRDKDTDLNTIVYKNALLRLMDFSKKLPVAILTSMYGQIYDKKINLRNRVQSISVNYLGEVMTARSGKSINNINNEKLISIIESKKVQYMFQKKHYEYNESYVSVDDPRYLRLFRETINYLELDGVKILK